MKLLGWLEQSNWSQKCQFSLMSTHHANQKPDLGLAQSATHSPRARESTRLMCEGTFQPKYEPTHRKLSSSPCFTAPTHASKNNRPTQRGIWRVPASIPPAHDCFSKRQRTTYLNCLPIAHASSVRARVDSVQA